MAGPQKLVFCLVLLAAPQMAFAGIPAATMRIEPEKILVDLFYTGTIVHVRGEAPAGDNLVILCIGEESTAELKQKGKVWGLLWLNIGNIAFKHVPFFYQLASSKKLEDLASDGDLIRAGVGFRALEAKAVPENGGERNRLFWELMKLKKSEGLYAMQEGQLEIDTQGPLQNYSTTFRFPAAAGPGEYRIHLVGFDEGKAVILADRALFVQLSGAAASIKSLSLNHGLLYGIFSVAVALAAGLLTGLVFGRRPHKGGH